MSQSVELVLQISCLFCFCFVGLSMCFCWLFLLGFLSKSKLMQKSFFNEMGGEHFLGRVYKKKRLGWSRPFFDFQLLDVVSRIFFCFLVSLLLPSIAFLGLHAFHGHGLDPLKDNTSRSTKRRRC